VGAGVGALVLGIGGRSAMRGIAILSGAPAFILIRRSLRGRGLGARRPSDSSHHEPARAPRTTDAQTAANENEARTRQDRDPAHGAAPADSQDERADARTHRHVAKFGPARSDGAHLHGLFQERNGSRVERIRARHTL